MVSCINVNLPTKIKYKKKLEKVQFQRTQKNDSLLQDFDQQFNLHIQEQYCNQMICCFCIIVQ